MSNMSYCRFENTARDLRDCVNAYQSGDVADLKEYEVVGLQEILDLANTIVNDEDFIKEIIEWHD